MDQNLEGQSAREQIHEIHREPNGVIVEGWLNPDTKRPERIIQRFEGGIIEERIFDSKTGERESITMRDDKGNTILFEDTAALGRIQKSQDIAREKMSAQSPYISSRQQLEVKSDDELLRGFERPEELGN